MRISERAPENPAVRTILAIPVFAGEVLVTPPDGDDEQARLRPSDTTLTDLSLHLPGRHSQSSHGRGGSGGGGGGGAAAGTPDLSAAAQAGLTGLAAQRAKNQAAMAAIGVSVGTAVDTPLGRGTVTRIGHSNIRVNIPGVKVNGNQPGFQASQITNPAYRPGASTPVPKAAQPTPIGPRPPTPPGPTRPALLVRPEFVVDNKIRSSTPLGKEASEALGAIGSLHQLPAQMPGVELRNGGGNMKMLGAYYHNPVTDVPSHINLNPKGKYPALTTAHEIGHYLDHKLFGQDVHGFGSHSRTLTGQSPSPHPTPYQQWHQAITNTPTYKTLQANRSLMPKYVDYLNTPTEMFARSYAQWVATKSQNPTMMAELAILRGTKGQKNVPNQWLDNEFAPVSRAFDAMFGRRGLTTNPVPAGAAAAGG
jgi:hypothetical protein